mmetsp:Transcript_27350/g.49223  ORF Transcript_27350/g.49223 Transcript_27350/m.49223 type:complete len:286 (+) Transcript_27350:16-873(+)
MLANQLINKAVCCMDAYTSTLTNLEYHEEVLSHLESKGSNGYQPKRQLSRELRENLVNWVFDVCYDLKGSNKTGQLAVVLFDSFVSSRDVTNVSVYKLVVSVALMLAFKVAESFCLTAQEVHELCGKAYSVPAVMTTERFMLETLRWNLLLPTAAEALPYLLAFTEDYEALGVLLARCDAYAAVCYSDIKLSKHSANTIAATAFCCVLSRLNRLHTNKGAATLGLLPENMRSIFESQKAFEDFKEDWLLQLEGSDLLLASQVIACQTQLEMKLSRLQSPSTDCTE